MRIPSNKGNIKIYGRYYVVQFGDSLYAIAQKFNLSLENLLAYNDQVRQSQTIYPGEILFIPDNNLKARSKTLSNRRRTIKKK